MGLYYKTINDATVSERGGICHWVWTCQQSPRIRQITLCFMMNPCNLELKDLLNESKATTKIPATGTNLANGRRAYVKRPCVL